MVTLNVVDLPQRQDAFCTRCKAEVMVLPDLACPRCGQAVHPLSLAVVPDAARRQTTNPVEPQAPSPSEAGRLTLPRIDEVVRWHAETERLLSSLADDEARLVADLRGVRQMRKLLAHILGLIEKPPPETPPPSVPPDPPVRAPSKSAPPANVSDRPWSRNHAACLDCGRTDRKHLARGYCTACYAKQWKGGDR
jgi:hypothetical protein